MLLRVLWGRVPASELEGVQARLRSRIDRQRIGARGLFGVRTGYRLEGDAAELIVASIWEDHAAMDAGVRAESALPAHERPFRGFLEAPRSEIYELVTEVVRSVALFESGVLRVHRLGVPIAREVEFAAFARRNADALLARPEVTDVYVGRRLAAADRLEILLVIGWRDHVAFRTYELSDERVAGVASARNLVLEHDVRTFDELGYRVPGTPSPGPALFVLDDHGRIADATASAAAMLGRDPWDLVGARMEDFVPERWRVGRPERWQAFLERGWAAGDFELLRGSGGEVLVRFFGKANTPVPGRHTLLFVDRGGPAPTEADFEGSVAWAFQRRRDSPSARE